MAPDSPLGHEPPRRNICLTPIRPRVRAAAGLLGCSFLAAAHCLGWGTAWADEPRAEPTNVRCEPNDVTVRSAGAVDVQLACAGARDAIGFLTAQGLDVTPAVAIDLVAELSPTADHASAGIYLEPEARVVILTFAEFRKFRTWFKIPIDAPLYRSLVAHEVAHALAAANFRIPDPSIQAKEYIAYVTMMATMPPALRERILSRFRNHGFDGDWQMGTTIYMLDPMRFGVKAYQHFVGPDGGRDYLDAILAGKVMVE